MPLNDSLDINVQQHNIDPVMLVDEVSSIEYYIGVSRSYSDPTKLNWRIKKIWKDGSVWNFGFPSGDQKFEYAWSERLNYNYMQ